MKTMKRFLNILAIGTATLAVASCNLDLYPEGTLTYFPEKIITNEDDLNGFQVNVYSSLRSLDHGIYDISDLMLNYFNASSDYANNYGGVHRADGTLNASDYDTRDNWSGPYSAIKNFNIVIKGTKPADVPAELVSKANIVRGEAFFARAYAYLHMVRLFGPAYATNPEGLAVPVVLEYNQSERPARNTVAEVYEAIGNDLDSAAVLLAGVAGKVRSEAITIDAVKALQARYYLDTKEYGKAASTAAALCDSETYALANDADKMEEEFVNDNGTEPILQFFANLQEGIGSHSYYGTIGADSDAGYDQIYNSPYFVPSKVLVDSYNEGDLRLAQWFNDEVAVKIGTKYFDDGVKIFSKYFGNPDLLTGSPATQQAKKPLTIAEMYLIAAEAYLADNNGQKALQYLSALQSARNTMVTTATAENIHNEWFREVVGEGLYMSCLKRWNMGYTGRPAQDILKDAFCIQTDQSGNFADKSLPASDYHWVWPVPTYEMKVNANLVQNPGYESVAE